MQRAISDQLTFEVNAFINSRQSKRLSPVTIKWYQDQFRYFRVYLDKIGFSGRIEDLTPFIIRDYLVDISTHATEDSMHSAYRAIRALLRWWEKETEPEGWKNPILKVEAPKVVVNPLPGVSREVFEALVNTCEKSFTGFRDRAILRALLDTGARRSEFIRMNVSDLDIEKGTIEIASSVINGKVQDTKNRKRRVVFLGADARRDVIRYLRVRNDVLPSPALWVTVSGTRLTKNGFREIVRRRSNKAGVEEPGLHDFRRAFALQARRNGMNEIELMRIMGESSLQVLDRYLDQDDDDLRNAHESASPGNRW